MLHVVYNIIQPTTLQGRVQEFLVLIFHATPRILFSFLNFFSFRIIARNPLLLQAYIHRNSPAGYKYIYTYRYQLSGYIYIYIGIGIGTSWHDNNNIFILLSCALFAAVHVIAVYNLKFPNTFYVLTLLLYHNNIQVGTMHNGKNTHGKNMSNVPRTSCCVGST